MRKKTKDVISIDSLQIINEKTYPQAQNSLGSRNWIGGNSEKIALKRWDYWGLHNSISYSHSLTATILAHTLEGEQSSDNKLDDIFMTLVFEKELFAHKSMNNVHIKNFFQRLLQKRRDNDKVEYKYSKISFMEHFTNLLVDEFQEECQAFNEYIWNYFTYCRFTFNKDKGTGEHELPHPNKREVIVYVTKTIEDTHHRPQENHSRIDEKINKIKDNLKAAPRKSYCFIDINLEHEYLEIIDDILQILFDTLAVLAQSFHRKEVYNALPYFIFTSTFSVMSILELENAHRGTYVIKLRRGKDIVGPNIQEYGFAKNKELKLFTHKYIKEILSKGNLSRDFFKLLYISKMAEENNLSYAEWIFSIRGIELFQGGFRQQDLTGWVDLPETRLQNLFIDALWIKDTLETTLDTKIPHISL